jgi:arginyl-tRNA synthetase
MPDGTHVAVRSANLLDDLEHRLREVDDQAFALAPVLQPGAGPDVLVAVRNQGRFPLLETRLSAQLEVSCEALPDGRLSIRFDDEEIARAGTELEGGEPACMATDDLLAGLPYIVDYCDPNATKALHVGHLRNIALGHAVAATLEAAGADVQRQSQIADAGRSMGEAVAGYVRYGENASPASAGEKSDRFVGRLYARYVRELEATAAGVDPGDAPVAHDLDERDDLARRLLMRWEHGEPEELALWRTVRDWAVAGQDETLARLGVRFERPIYDSDSVPEIEPLLAFGLERGILRRGEHGGIVYETGHEAYPRLPLTRGDGLPTQNLRVVAIWSSLMREVPGVTLIHFSGDEWRTHRLHVEELLRKLHPEQEIYPTRYPMHGMVSVAGRVMSSSSGEALLIDDLLDELLASDELHAAVPAGCERCRPDQLAAITLLGLCLDRPMAKPLVVDPARLLETRTSAGWRLAQAWARAWDPANDGPPDPAPEDPGYRYLVMRTQFYRRLLADTVERNDVFTLLRYLAHVAAWYLGGRHHPRVGRAMRSTLDTGLTALGLIER